MYNYGLPNYQNMQQQPMPQNNQPFMPYGYQRSNLNGRIVDDFSQITAQEIPMDGTQAVFIKRDLSGLVLKHWNSDGTISSVLFNPVADVKPDTDRFSDIEKRLSDLENAFMEK